MSTPGVDSGNYPWSSINGSLNICYLYMSELEKCYQNKMYPGTRCKNERDDFLECHSRQKHRHALKQVSDALATAVNINVPHYNIENDTFVYDDGKVIANNDPVFKEYKWL